MRAEVVRRVGRQAVAALAGGVLTALLVLPLAVEQAVEHASFHDRLGTLPVEVGLAHSGVSTLDTGILGRLYWNRTGVAGFGASVRSSGPPLADGTFSSYLSSDFLQANAALVDDPDAVADAYGTELRAQVVAGAALREAVALMLGCGLGVVLLVARREQTGPRGRHRRRRAALAAGSVLVVLGVSSGAAWQLFEHWEGSAEPATSYPMTGVEQLSFSSPQARAVAEQVRPFVEKNAVRLAARAAEFERTAGQALGEQLRAHADGLAVRTDEHVVLAEADPQGSLVATRVRAAAYPVLEDVLGEGRLVLRTVAGDVSSNGALAEQGFVAAEAAASGEVPTVAVKGDHDSSTTVEQLVEGGVQVPDQEVVEAGGLRVAGAADPAFKTLFGTTVVNPSGASEREVGQALREEVGDDVDPLLVVVHQPSTAAGFLGVDDTDALASGEGHETRPWDDGVADAPPGSLTIGHLHDPGGPWVLWNTDVAPYTWTVVTQLGTSGGVQESPTFDRFSTPSSVPLKPISMVLQYVDDRSGLQTGHASVLVRTDGSVLVEDRVDLGSPDGQPVPVP